MLQLVLAAAHFALMIFLVYCAIWFPLSAIRVFVSNLYAYTDPYLKVSWDPGHQALSGQYAFSVHLTWVDHKSANPVKMWLLMLPSGSLLWRQFPGDNDIL